MIKVQKAIVIQKRSAYCILVCI